MIELPLVALAGLLGSAHCLGMCGGFALSLGAASTTPRNNLLRQSAYGFGRVFTYAVLGAAAGFGGNRIASSTALFNTQALLATATGFLLIMQGMYSAGVWSWLRKLFGSRRALPASSTFPSHARIRGGKPCVRRGYVGSLLSAPGMLSPMLAGVLTGFMPCGLVYAILLLAVNSETLFGGALTMACFGAGTLPVMTAFSFGAVLLKPSARPRLFRLSAACVILTGLLSVARGAAAWSASNDSREPTSISPQSLGKHPRCPLCPSVPSSDP